MSFEIFGDFSEVGSVALSEFPLVSRSALGIP